MSRYVVVITAQDGTKSVVGVFNSSLAADQWIERAAEATPGRDGINADEGFDVEAIQLDGKEL